MHHQSQALGEELMEAPQSSLWGVHVTCQEAWRLKPVGGLLLCLQALAGAIMVSSSAGAARTKYHRRGGLSNTHFFLSVLEAGKCKIKVPADWILGVGLLPSLQMATFSLCPHMTEKGSSGA